MKQNRILPMTLLCVFISLILISCSAVQEEQTATQMQETFAETELPAVISDVENKNTPEEFRQLTLAEKTLPAAEAENETKEGTEESEADIAARDEVIPVPQKDEIVRVLDYIPDIMIDLRYTTDNNFTGTVIYDFTDAYLRYGTIEKLAKAQEQAEEDGYSLKIWDAFRPVSAQFTLWEVYPNGTYVANPNKGYSSHSRGNTVDITLVRSDGTEIPMPTDLDDFSEKADRNYNDCTEEEAANAGYLERIMQENGFTPYSAEWWHFSDSDSYDVAIGIEIPDN